VSLGKNALRALLELKELEEKGKMIEIRSPKDLIKYGND